MTKSEQKNGERVANVEGAEGAADKNGRGSGRRHGMREEQAAGEERRGRKELRGRARAAGWRKSDRPAARPLAPAHRAAEYLINARAPGRARPGAFAYRTNPRRQGPATSGHSRRRAAHLLVLDSCGPAFL